MISPQHPLQGSPIRNTISHRGSRKYRLPRHLDKLPPRNQMPDTRSTTTTTTNACSARQLAVRRNCRKQATNNHTKTNQAAVKTPTVQAVNSSRSTAGPQRTNRIVKTRATANANHGIQSETSNSKRTGKRTGLGTALSLGHRIKRMTQRADATHLRDKSRIESEIKDNESDKNHDDSEKKSECMDFENEQEAPSKCYDKDHVRALVESLSDEQYQRFIVYRRASLNRTTVKALLSILLDQEVSQALTVVAAGFGKVFVGEMVERALEIMQEWGETGAIRPEHLREARRRSRREEQQRGLVASTLHGHQKRVFLM